VRIDGSLALKGPGIVIIEASAVVPEGKFFCYALLKGGESLITHIALRGS
jgi:hypothetical protein